MVPLVRLKPVLIADGDRACPVPVDNGEETQTCILWSSLLHDQILEAEGCATFCFHVHGHLVLTRLARQRHLERRTVGIEVFIQIAGGGVDTYSDVWNTGQDSHFRGGWGESRGDEKAGEGRKVEEGEERRVR
jgi:hypothetical protein